MSDNETFGYESVFKRKMRCLSEADQAKRIESYFTQSPAEVREAYEGIAESIRRGPGPKKSDG